MAVLDHVGRGQVDEVGPHPVGGEPAGPAHRLRQRCEQRRLHRVGPLAAHFAVQEDLVALEWRTAHEPIPIVNVGEHHLGEEGLRAGDLVVGAGDGRGDLLLLCARQPSGGGVDGVGRHGISWRRRTASGGRRFSRCLRPGSVAGFSAAARPPLAILQAASAVRASAARTDPAQDRGKRRASSATCSGVSRRNAFAADEEPQPRGRLELLDRVGRGGERSRRRRPDRGSRAASRDGAPPTAPTAVRERHVARRKVGHAAAACRCASRSRP